MWLHILILYTILVFPHTWGQSAGNRQDKDASSSSSSTKSKTSSSARRGKPNIVFFLVDDLGIGDIGCFGNDTIKTPNIDGLASIGAKLNHNLAPESMCTPSRAATLTGRYAIRSGMAAGPSHVRVLINLGTPGGLPSNEITFAHVLQKAGYKTGMIGKWHLGLNCEDRSDNCHHPLNMGFDEFYGLPFSNVLECGKNWTADGDQIPHLIKKRYAPLIVKYSVILALALVFVGVLSTRMGMKLVVVVVFVSIIAIVVEAVFVRRFVCVLMRGHDVVEQPLVLDNLTVKFTNEAKDFIQQNKDAPFLLFMSYAKVHTALFTSLKFKGHSVHSHYGDNVQEMDWSVGEIISKLQHESIFDNTFIYFTSDHGPDLDMLLPSGEYHGGSKGQYKGGKSQSWEGGIRVPTVATWPGHIPPGIVINEPTNTMDIFPIFSELAGGSIPRDHLIDGKNSLALLKQQESLSPHEFMFHYCGTAIHAVRYRPRAGKITWKAHFVTSERNSNLNNCFGEGAVSHDPPLLYDITNDPYEKNQVDIGKHEDVLAKIREAMLNHEAGIKPVPRQLRHSQWNPYLQPCCNFPFCTCSENP